MPARNPKSRPTPTAPLRVLMVASECAPFARTGGLGDVVAGLSKALHDSGHDVRICLPLYSLIDRDKHQIRFQRSAGVHMGANEQNWVGVHTTTLDGGVEVWLIDYERFFARPGLYDDRSSEYADNAYRFGLLSKAAIQLCKDANWIPDILHAHDWPAAPAPALLKTWDRVMSPMSTTASVLTIHNIGYQGVYHADVMRYLGIGPEHFTPDKFEDHGKVNLLKAGIAFADAITTVSPTHALEIRSAEGGMGLAPFINHRVADFHGILNGCDYEHWNPQRDPLLPARYTAKRLTGKRKCKQALQQRMHLTVDPKVPVFGIVSRFAPQKGFSLAEAALPRALRDMQMQLVVLGSGNPHTEGFFNWLAASFPGRVGVYLGFHNELSHWIEAGSDFFLMPSLYEPCGLNQMYSLKYGTLPLVRATGGLDDTVINYNEATGEGTGFKFHLPTGQALYDTIGWAVSTWYDRRAHIKQMQQQAMAEDFSWDRSAQHYLTVYRQALANRRG